MFLVIFAFMSQDSVERFLGRVITDEDFRECAKDSLSDACSKCGYKLSRHEEEILRILDLDDFVRIAKSIDKRIKRCRGLS